MTTKLALIWHNLLQPNADEHSSEQTPVTVKQYGRILVAMRKNGSDMIS